MTGKPFSRQLLIYVHIPFCSKKCPYCHFSVIKDNPLLYDRFVDALIHDIQQNQQLLASSDIQTLYFGGGTPSKLPTRYIRRILDAFVAIQPSFAPKEVTMEVNPEDVDLDWAIELKNTTTINRISIGMQSLNDDELVTIGRTHSASKAQDAIKTLHHAGFDNLSADLMMDLPNQTLHHVKTTLQALKELPLKHLSLYNLQIEENSAYFRKKKTIEKMMPSDDESSQILETLIRGLEELGYTRYEISAFCKDHKVSRHNMGYWQYQEYLGIGPSSCSYVNQERYRKIDNVMQYMQHVEEKKDLITFKEKLPYPHNFKEQLAISLRISNGILLPHLVRRYNQPVPQETFKAIKKLVDKGLIEKRDDHIRLTENGRRFYDDVAIELL